MPLATPTFFRRKGVFAALAVASVLLLGTGCAPESGLGGSLGGSTGGSAGSGSDNTDSSESGGNSSAGKLTGKDCLPGDWDLDNEKTAALFQQMAGGLVDNVRGAVTLTLRADGTATTNYQNWTHTVTIEGGRSEVERHGIDHGAWSAASDGHMAMEDTEVGSITTVTVTAGGRNIRTAITPEASIFAQGNFTCSGNDLTIAVEGTPAVLFRQR